MAAPTINASAIGVGTGTSVATATTLTISSGDAVYVGLILSDGPTVDASGVSSDLGGTFTQIGDSTVLPGFLRVLIYRSTNATAGSATITGTPTATTSEMGIVAVSLSGVDISGTPNGSASFTNGSGTGDAASASISSGTDALVLDFIGRIQSDTMNATGGNTILQQANYAGTLQSGSSWEAGAASVTTSWGINGHGTVSNWQWILGALSINGATGGGGGGGGSGGLAWITA